MIDVGNTEDPDYTARALSFMYTFEDVLKLPDNELAEVVGRAPPRMTAMAIATQAQETKDRFLKCAKTPVAIEIRDYLGGKVEIREMGGAQLKLVEATRQAEKKGLIKTKRIPLEET